MLLHWSLPQWKQWIRVGGECSVVWCRCKPCKVIEWGRGRERPLAMTDNALATGFTIQTWICIVFPDTSSVSQLRTAWVTFSLKLSWWCWMGLTHTAEHFQYWIAIKNGSKSREGEESRYSTLVVAACTKHTVMELLRASSCLRGIYCT